MYYGLYVCMCLTVEPPNQRQLILRAESLSSFRRLSSGGTNIDRVCSCMVCILILLQEAKELAEIDVLHY